MAIDLSRNWRDLSAYKKTEQVPLFTAFGIKGATMPTLTPDLTQAYGESNMISTGASTSPLGRGVGASTGTGTSAGTGPVNPGPVNTSGGTLNKAELEALWIKAGGNPAVANLAAAIALAESGGRDINSPPNSNGTIDRGYWQINSSHGSQSTLDPLGNARAAVAISANGTNWSPWVTFQKGLYKPFL